MDDISSTAGFGHNQFVDDALSPTQTIIDTLDAEMFAAQLEIDYQQYAPLLENWLGSCNRFLEAYSKPGIPDEDTAEKATTIGAALKKLAGMMEADRVALGTPVLALTREINGFFKARGTDVATQAAKRMEMLLSNYQARKIQEERR